MIKHQGTDTRLEAMSLFSLQKTVPGEGQRAALQHLQEAPEQMEPGSQSAARWDDERQRAEAGRRGLDCRM